MRVESKRLTKRRRRVQQEIVELEEQLRKKEELLANTTAMVEKAELSFRKLKETQLSTLYNV